MGESGNLMKNLLNNIDVFHGQKSRFEDWVMKTTICFEHCYPLIAEIVNGKVKPPEVIGYRSLTDQRGSSRTTLQRGVGGRPDPLPTSTSGGVPVGPPSASAGEVESQASPTSTADTVSRETESARFERITREAAAKARADIEQQKQQQASAPNVAEPKDSSGQEGADVGESHTLEDPGGSRGLSALDFGSVAEQQMQRAVLLNKPEIDDWVKANGVLYDVLYLRTKGVAASLVKKHRPQPRARGDGYRVWSDLIDKFQPDDQQYRRELIAELNNISMKEGTDPDTFLAEVQDLANKLEYLGEGVSDARLADIVLQGLPPSYDQLRLMADMDSGFTFAKIERTARNMYKSQSRGRQQQHHGHRRDTHVRDSGMVAFSSKPHGSTQLTCHSCGESGHVQRFCPRRQQRRNSRSGATSGSGGTNQPRHQRGNRNFSRTQAPAQQRETKWCQLHNTPYHSNAECKAQAAARQAAATSSRGAAAGHADNSAAATPETATSAAASTHQASSAPSTASPQAATEPYSGSMGFSWLTATHTSKLFEFVHGATWWISLMGICGLSYVSSWCFKALAACWKVGSSWTTAGHSSTAAMAGGTDGFSMLVDSGASAHFVDSDLIPDLCDCLESYQELKPPMIITTAGMRRVYGTAAGVLPCFVVDTDGVERQVSVRVTVVPGMGKHLFSPKFAQRQGIHTIFAADNYIDATAFKVGLRHFELLDYVDLRLARGVPARRAVGGKPHVRDDTAMPTPPVALATVATSANVWHRRLGHPNEAVVRAVAKIPETGVVFSDAMSKCDTCLVSKSTQQAHPKTAVHRATEPLGCVYTDLIGPVSPVAKGGYMYVSKFTDELTRYKAFYLIRSKTEAIDTLVRFVEDLAIPYGRRVVRLRSDGGGEYRAGYFQKYCKQTGIIQEFTATNTPQQNGISERDGRTIMEVTRCLLQGANLPGWLWGEVCCTAVYLVNRLPHSALGFHTPYFKMFGEQAALSHLRVVGARAFVHYEHHREKLQDRAWEGRLVGYSKDSRAYRIYNPATRRVVESRNVTFIETPDAPLPAAAADTRKSSFPPGADSRGNVCFGDDSDSDSSVDSGDDGDIESDADADVDEDPIEPDGHHRRPPDGTNRQLRSKGRLPSAPTPDLSARQRRALRQLAFSVSSNATAPLVPPASIPTPNTFKQAMASPFRSKWKGAMEKELQSLKDHEVADLVTIDTLPPGASPIGSRWVFKVKPDGTFKARLVVQGYGQRHGIDCGGTFAPVCRISSQRTLLCIAASKGLHVEHLDVKTAFLNAPVDEDVWVYQAPGFEDNHPVTGKPQVLKLRKSLYGLRQSPRNWNNTFACAIESIGFKSIYSDPCVYVYGSGKEYVVLSIYVDDVLLLGVDPSVVKNIREQLMNKFSMTNLGSASLVLGMEIEQGDGYIKVSQGNYVNSILRKFDFHDSNPAPTPGVGKPLQSNPDGAVYLDKSGTKRYQEIVGTLMYLVNTTRWDIAHAVLGLTRGMAAPTEEHLIAAKRVLRYLRGTPDLPTIYRKGPLELVGFTDSDFAGELESRRSCTGFLFMLGGGVISSAAVLQKTIAQSTTEAELMALHAASQEGTYLLNLLRELGVDIGNFKLFSDAMSALSLSSQAMFSSLQSILRLSSTCCVSRWRTG